VALSLLFRVAESVMLRWYHGQRAGSQTATQAG
jgi:hypothetical protein